MLTSLPATGGAIGVGVGVGVATGGGAGGPGLSRTVRPLASAVARHREVGTGVAVEVRDRHAVGAGDRHALDGAVATGRLAAQHGDRSGAVGGDREVTPPVAVEVGRGDPERAVGNRDRGALQREARVPGVAQQHGHRVGVGLGDGEVVAAAAVEVGGDDAEGPEADRDVRRLGREAGAARAAQQDRDAVRAGVRDGEVGQRVAVEVPDRELRGERAGRVRALGRRSRRAGLRRRTETLAVVA